MGARTILPLARSDTTVVHSPSRGYHLGIPHSKGEVIAMAHFLAAIQGHRGEASRLGTKKSGLDATAASWQGSVSVRLWHDAKTGRDMARVSLEPWHGSGVSRGLYYGPVT